MTQVTNAITSFTLAEFVKNSNNFEWFKNASKLGTDIENELDKYYSLEYDVVNPPLYLADPLYATITGRSVFHCFRVLFNDGDSVLVVYKTHEFMKKRIHVFDIPISANRDEKHSKAVVRLLLLTGFVTFFYKQRYTMSFDVSYSKEQYDDYYFDLKKDKEEKFDNPHWQIDHGIRRLTENGKYAIIDIHGRKEYFKKAMECRREWWKHMDAGKTDTERKLFENSLKCDDPRIRQIALVYDNNIVLGVKTVLAYPEKKYAVELIYSHMSRSKPELLRDHPEIDNIVLSNIDSCMRYAVGTNLLKDGIWREYWLGFTPKNVGLKEHKDMISDGFIRYFSTVKS